MMLQDKVAIVTGASSGIGRAAAERFAAEGARVALVARGEGGLRQVADAIGAAALVLPADLRQRAQCERVVDVVAERCGRLDIVVNAAGALRGGSIESTRVEDWTDQLQLNLEAVYHLLQRAVPHLKKTRGSVVNVSSVASARVFPNLLAYCVSKAALDQLTRCVAIELAPAGVRVNAVNPGVVQTNLHRAGGMAEATYATFLEHSRTTHPLGRIGTAEEIAEAILFLASERSGWVTGETLLIDGGRHLTCAR
jgi:NAD(P)-dependent dehydrogenase (short-subunit alcohol dehydrogenase family)